MKYLMIVGTTIENPAWVAKYLDKVTPLLSKFEGKYLTRTSNVEILEGDNKPQYSLLAEFPSKEKALEFYHSVEYAPYKEARMMGSKSSFLLLPVENETA